MQPVSSGTGLLAEYSEYSGTSTDLSSKGGRTNLHDGADSDRFYSKAMQ